MLNINERINYQQEKINFKLKITNEKEFIYLEEKTTNSTILKFLRSVNQEIGLAGVSNILDQDRLEKSLEYFQNLHQFIKL